LLPAILTLQYPSERTDQPHFWNFLDTLAISSYDFTKQTILNLNYSTHARFDWLGGIDEDCAPFIGRLLPVAVALYKRNIVITDERGRDVMSLGRM
jgi:hypothetical protein